MPTSEGTIRIVSPLASSMPQLAEISLVEKIVRNSSPSLQAGEISKLVMEYAGHHRHFFQAFEAKAEAKETKDLPAIAWGNESQLTYSALNAQANQLARFFLKIKAENNSTENFVVGLFFYQSKEYVVSVLALMKAGITFTPLSANTEISTQRLVNYAKGAEVKLVLTHSSLKSRDFLATEQVRKINKTIFIDEIKNEVVVYSADNPNVIVKLDQLAYIHSTSGSTGTPKQILIKYRGLYNCMRAHIDLLELTAKDCIAAFADIAFDAHLMEIMMTLGAGACLYPVSHKIRTDLRKLAHFYNTSKITVSIFTPSMLTDLRRNDFPTMRVMLSTGEKVTKEIVVKWHETTTAADSKKDFLFINGYGPAEVTIATSMAILKPGDEIHIGTAIPGLRMLVLEQEPKLLKVPQRVKAGEEGELYIAGEGIGNYADRTLDAERFREIKDPDDPSKIIRVFQTRDRAVCDEQNRIYLKGRLDRQIKFYSKLICPEEIEETLLQCSNIAHAYVDAKKDKAGHPYLIAYIQLQNKTQPFNLRQIYYQVVNALTATMAPTRWVMVDNVPLNASGKIDGNALAALPIAEQTILRVRGVSRVKVKDTKLADNLAAKLAELWCKILNIENKDFAFQVDDNFLELGGDSLRCTALLSLLREEPFKLKLSQEEFFESPTFGLLLRRIKRSQETLPLSPEVIILQNEKITADNPALFLIHTLLGDPEEDYPVLNKHWPEKFPVRAIKARGRVNADDMDDNLEMIAADYLRTIRKHQSKGPYLLGGWSAGGIFAFVIATMLRNRGEEVAVMMIDSEAPTTYQAKSDQQYTAFLLDLFVKKLYRLLSIDQNALNKEESALLKKTKIEQIAHFFDVLSSHHILSTSDDPVDIKTHNNEKLIATVKGILTAILHYQIPTFEGVTLFAATETQAASGEQLGWPTTVKMEEVIPLTGNHESIILEDKAAKLLAQKINAWRINKIRLFKLNKIYRDHKSNLMTQFEHDRLELDNYVELMGYQNLDVRVSVNLKMAVDNFISTNKKILLLFGNPCSGKTLFCKHSARQILQIQQNIIVLYLELPSIPNPTQNLINKCLKIRNFTDDEISFLKTSRQRTVIFLDGYNELPEDFQQNLYSSTNRLQEWNVQLIITCRFSYVAFVNDHRAKFAPIMSGVDHEMPSAFEEILIAPFSQQQIQQYLAKRKCSALIDKLSGDLLRLAEIPYLLYLLANELLKPSLALEQVLYRKLIDSYVERYYRKLITTKRLAPTDGDIKASVMEYCRQLAIGPREIKVEVSEAKLLEGSPLNLLPKDEKNNEWRWEFFAGCLLEYFTKLPSAKPVGVFSAASSKKLSTLSISISDTKEKPARIWSVPSPPKSYVERKALIDLEDALKRQLPPDCPVVIITGPPGVGKTQASYQYASSHHFNADSQLKYSGGAFVFNAESDASLFEGFKQLAVKFKLIAVDEMDGWVFSEKNRDVLMKALKQKLLICDRLLLIFDNASKVKELLFFLKKENSLLAMEEREGHAHHVLITSCDAHCAPHIVRRLSNYDTAEAEAYIKKVFANSSIEIQLIPSEISELAELLSHYPLALAQAVNTIIADDKQPWTIKGYIAAYKDTAQRKTFMTQSSLDDAHKTVMTTWQLALTRFKACQPEYADKIEHIFHLMACFRMDKIPLEFFHIFCHKKYGWNKAQVIRFMQTCAKYSLLEFATLAVDNDGVLLHQIFQTVLRYACQAALQDIINFIVDHVSYDQYDGDNVDLWSLMYLHVENMLKLAIEYKYHESTAYLLLRINLAGYYIFEHINYSIADEWLPDLAKDVVRQFSPIYQGKYHLFTLMQICGRRPSDKTTILAEFKEAADVLQSVFSIESSMLSINLCRVNAIYHNVLWSDLDAALKLNAETIVSFSKIKAQLQLDKNYGHARSYLKAYIARIELLVAANKASEAEPLLTEALDFVKQQEIKGSHRYPHQHHMLLMFAGQVYTQLGNYVKAEGFFTEGFAKFKNELKTMPEIKRYIRYHKGMGELRYIQGRYEEAYEFYQRRYEKLLQIYGGKNDLDVVEGLLDKTEAEIAFKKDAITEGSLETIETMRKKVLQDNEENLTTARLLLLKAKFYEFKNHLAEALQHCEKCIKVLGGIKLVQSRYYQEATQLLKKLAPNDSKKEGEQGVATNNMACVLK